MVCDSTTVMAWSGFSHKNHLVRIKIIVLVKMITLLRFEKCSVIMVTGNITGLRSQGQGQGQVQLGCLIVFKTTIALNSSQGQLSKHFCSRILSCQPATNAANFSRLKTVFGPPVCIWVQTNIVTQWELAFIYNDFEYNLTLLKRSRIIKNTRLKKNQKKNQIN